MMSRFPMSATAVSPVCFAAMCMAIASAACFGQKQAAAEEVGRSALSISATFEQVETMKATLRPSGGNGGAVRGPGCPQTLASLTTADFGGDAFLLQAGFGEGEIAAVTYQLPSGAFPIKVDILEFILGTDVGAAATTTEYSILVWDGPPNTGILVFEYASNDLDLPHAPVGPGEDAVNIFVTVDPNDPEQIFVFNDSGTNRFSIGLRIDVHNNQTANPCDVAPPPTQNAFPAVDLTRNFASQNWLFGLNCGPIGCPSNGGWSTFANLFSFCQPSGDWAMRATWSSIDCVMDPTGPCCVSGACSIQTEANCTAAGGSWTVGGSCSPNPCPSTTGACCFGDFCQILEPAACSGFGGTFIGLGVLCGPSATCPLGACCMPNGTCVAGLSSPACTGMGGAFQGVGTSCTSNNCPQPVGACCSSTNFCFPLTQANCNGIPGATWQGPLTSCEPNPCGAAQTGACCIGGTCVVVTEAECVGANSRFAGVGTACNEPGNNTQPCCRADFDQNDTVAVPDIFAFLAAWFAGDASANFDGEGASPTVPDIFAFLSAWFARCD